MPEVPPRDGRPPTGLASRPHRLRRLVPARASARATADRVPELDALRGLAAVAVVLFHSNPSRIPFGWAAVDLFFVLSGYLITGIVLRHGRSPGFLRRFYVRRGLRVWPAYYLLVLGLAAAGPWLWRPFWWAGLPYTLTFTQGLPLYWGGQAPAFTWYLGHTWTLAIEEQFYLAWPVVVLLAGPRRLVPVALGAALLSALSRGAGLNLSLLGARGDGLALGGLLAAWLAPGVSRLDRDALARRFGRTAALALVALVAIRLLAGPDLRAGIPRWPGVTVLAYSVLWLGVVGWAACRSGSPGLAWLRAEPLRRLGTVSYGLYLYHLPILLLSVDVANACGFRGPQILREVPALALCGLAAWASWVGLERPVLAWKDRWNYAPQARQAVADVP